MAILITGGLGAIGSWVVRLLAEEALAPVIYDSTDDRGLIADMADKVEIVKGDILDLPRILSTLKEKKIRRIIHAAASITPELNPYLGVRINIEGTLNMLEAARLYELERVVFTSAKGVFGNIEGEYAHPTYKPVDEDYPRNPVNLYCRTKLAAEHLCEHYKEFHKLSVVVLRFSKPYGPGRLRRHGAYPVECRMIENAMAGKETKIGRGAEQKEDFIYTRDIAEGVVRACLSKEPEHLFYNIGSGKAATLGDFKELLQKRFPGVSIEIGPGLDFMQMDFRPFCVFDISRAMEDLGFKPQYDLESGIDDYIKMVKLLN